MYFDKYIIYIFDKFVSIFSSVAVALFYFFLFLFYLINLFLFFIFYILRIELGVEWTLLFLFKPFRLRIELGLERTSDGRRSDGRRAIQSYFKTTRRAIHSMAGWSLYLWHLQLLNCIVLFLWHLQLLGFCNFLSSFHGHGNFDGTSFHFHGLLSFRFVLSRWICIFHGLLSFRALHLSRTSFVSFRALHLWLLWFDFSALLYSAIWEERNVNAVFNSIQDFLQHLR